MKLTHRVVLLVCTFVLAACQQNKDSIPEAPVVTASVKENSVKIVPINALANTQLEWAITDAQREHGLMSRTNLATHSGMVFTFEQPTTACFWMKNTLIPLSVGFINAQGILVQIEDMQPQTLKTHCAQTPIQYAVEMNQGWFKHNNVTVGTPLFKIENHQ